MDKITIHDLAARCIIGMNGDERREKQDVLINISLYADLRQAGISDRIEDTVDYRALKKKVLTLGRIFISLKPLPTRSRRYVW